MSQFKKLNTEEISNLMNGVSENEKKSTKSIKEFIFDLEKEIKALNSQIEKEEGLSQLTEMLKTYAGEDKLVSSYEIAERIKNRPEEKKILSGYQGLDDILQGFRQKQLIVMSAATKSGKTSFCIELTSRMKEYNPTWLPFEEGAEELIQKFIDRNETPPLFFTPNHMIGNTLLWVEKKIIEAKAKYNSQVIFIDHLHFVVDFGENMSVQIGRTMRELKRMAKQWDIIIFLIAHLKKTKMDTQPELEDLRDSSFIAQEADTVIMLWRETKKERGEVVISNNVNLSVQANRRTGKTGNVKFIFEDGKFTEHDWREDMSEETEKKIKFITNKKEWDE